MNITLPRATNDGAKELIEKINSVCSILPPGVDKRLFCSSVVVAANEVGKKCSTGSLLKAAFNCACLGLMPGAALRMAYFIPYKGICTLIIGYPGYLELAYRNAYLKTVYAEVILTGEKFRHFVDCDGPHVIHDIPLERELRKENVLGSYCVYATQAGGYGVNVIPRSELNKVDTKANVWASDYVAMCCKTPVRRAAKFWQTAPSMKQAIHLDELADRGEEQPDIAGMIENDANKPSFSLNDLADPGATSEAVGNAQPEYVTAPPDVSQSDACTKKDFEAAMAADQKPLKF